jgi:hypothetical protein
VRTTTATTVPVVADAWTRLRIACDGGGAIYFSINGTVVATHTATIPAAGHGPFVAIRKTHGSSATLSLRVDYVYLRAAALR